MTGTFVLEYWIDDGWYVGRLRDAPGVFAQGETLEELEANIREVYALMREEALPVPPKSARTTKIGEAGRPDSSSARLQLPSEEARRGPQHLREPENRAHCPCTSAQRDQRHPLHPDLLPARRAVPPRPPVRHPHHSSRSALRAHGPGTGSTGPEIAKPSSFRKGAWGRDGSAGIAAARQEPLPHIST